MHTHSSPTLQRRAPRAGALLCASLCAPLIAPGPAHAVIGGEPTTSQEWPAVVGLMYDVGDGLEPGCTGTVIAPRVVLTAAHCVAHRDGVSDQDPIAVRLGTADLARGGRDVAVSAVRAMSNGLDGFDLALLFLAEDACVAPAPLARGCGAATQGGRVTLVGFGVTDREAFGELHRVDLRVSELACTDPELGCDDHDGRGAYLVATPGGMCGGDSGGPLFVVNAHGRFVAGVVSGPAQDETSDLCDDWRRALYPRPDTVASWIEAEIGAALEAPGCDGATAPSPPPDEPAPPGEPAPTAPSQDIFDSRPEDDPGCAAGAGSSELSALLAALLGWASLRHRLRASPRRSPCRRRASRPRRGPSCRRRRRRGTRRSGRGLRTPRPGSRRASGSRRSAPPARR